MVNLNDAYEIAKYIKDAEKQTPVKVYISGDLKIEKSQYRLKTGQNDTYHLTKKGIKIMIVTRKT